MTNRDTAPQWWDVQGVSHEPRVEEVGLWDEPLIVDEEVTIYRYDLECVYEGDSGSWMSPPEPPAYEPRFMEHITVRPTPKWYGRGCSEAAPAATESTQAKPEAVSGLGEDNHERD